MKNVCKVLAGVVAFPIGIAIGLGVANGLSKAYIKYGKKQLKGTK